MAHPRGFCAKDVSGQRYMFGEVEDGYAVWDKLEPVNRTELPSPDVFPAHDKVLVLQALSRSKKRRQAKMLNEAARAAWIRRKTGGKV